MLAAVRPFVLILALFVAILGGPVTRVSAEEAPAVHVMPPTIQVESLLRSTTAEMLEKSPTFRRQCDRIGAATGLVVKVRVVPSARNSFTRATTTFRRYTSGVTVADVEIPAASRLVELLAHEFEHIAEYVEGIDLKTLVKSEPGEAFQLRDGSFETSRAVQAGRDAAFEMYRK